LPGFVGLNNLNKTDGINAVIQALAHVPPLRDYFLLQTHSDAACNKGKSVSSQHRMAEQVTKAFGELVRKLWSHERFKCHIDPHMLIQAISAGSKKKFQIGHQAEAGELMTWLLHQLHLGSGGGKKPGSSIIQRVFQGQLNVTTRQAKKKQTVENEADLDDRYGSDDDEGPNESDISVQDEPHVVIDETSSDSYFLQLTLDIPEKPLFRDEDGGLVIPQEPLINVLKKFDGVSFSDALSRSGEAQRKRYRLCKLPNYLILHLARFKMNQYIRAKNPTIVAFPVKNLDLNDYVTKNGSASSELPTEEDVRRMSVSFSHSSKRDHFCFLSQ
jgi:U4/U6.U5 tri-snRNP-associated protein 2